MDSVVMDYDRCISRVNYNKWIMSLPLLMVHYVVRIHNIACKLAVLTYLTLFELSHSI